MTPDMLLAKHLYALSSACQLAQAAAVNDKPLRDRLHHMGIEIMQELTKIGLRQCEAAAVTI